MNKKSNSTKDFMISTSKSKIQQLLTCIAKDQAELSKQYKKALMETDKKHLSISKLLVKAKQSVAQAKKNRKKSPENYKSMTYLLDTLKKESTVATKEQLHLKSEHKKFLAAHKACLKMTKSSA